jgi:hypothetical protein
MRRETIASGASQCGVAFVRAASTTLRSRGVDANHGDHAREPFPGLNQPIKQIIRLERVTCHRRLSTGSHLTPIDDFSERWGSVAWVRVGVR